MSSPSTRCWAQGTWWPFPLPLPEVLPIRSSCATSGYLRQRLVRKQAQQRLFRESVNALNSLSNSTCRVLRDEPGPTSRSSASPFSPTGSQSSVLRRVRAEVIGAGPPPVGHSEQEALTELLRCQDLNALQPQHLADYDLNKLRVTEGGVLPKDAIDLVSPSLAEVLRQPCSVIRSPAELFHLEESEPHHTMLGSRAAQKPASAC